MTDVQATLKAEQEDAVRGARPVFELFEGFALTSVLASLERAGLLERLEGAASPPTS